MYLRLYRFAKEEKSKKKKSGNSSEGRLASNAVLAKLIFHFVSLKYSFRIPSNIGRKHQDFKHANVNISDKLPLLRGTKRRGQLQLVMRISVPGCEMQFSNNI